MKKQSLLITVACGLLLAGCVAPADQQSITMNGSDTMLKIGQRWAELYMKAHPEVTIQVAAGGSGVGIAALIAGTTSICQASRAMKDSERESLKEKRNLEAVETPVALDALAIYVNRDNPVNALTIEQVGKIFRGEITNWKEVGGADATIVLYGRENSSGTYVYFKEHILENKDFASKYQALPGTGSVVDAVSKDKAGVGYGGIGYASTIKTLNVAKDAASAPIEPTMANVLNKTYPIARELYWYTAGPPDETVKPMLDWVLSAEGQKAVEEEGFYPLNSRG